MAKQITFSPHKQSRATFSLIYSEPKCNTGGKPILNPPYNPHNTPPDPHLETSSERMSSWNASN